MSLADGVLARSAQLAGLIPELARTSPAEALTLMGQDVALEEDAPRAADRLASMRGGSVGVARILIAAGGLLAGRSEALKLDSDTWEAARRVAAEDPRALLSATASLGHMVEGAWVEASTLVSQAERLERGWLVEGGATRPCGSPPSHARVSAPWAMATLPMAASCRPPSSS